jgi:hypothetical protein
MILLIGGHQRSGTTLLGHVCNSHPEIAVTHEFGNFLALGRTYKAYSRQIFRRWLNVQNKWAFDSSFGNGRRKNFRNLLFVTRYLFKVYQYRNGLIDILAIESALRSVFPGANIVGDKWPDFVFLLDRLVKLDELFLVIIYRDCRDVVSSTLEQARTRWPSHFAKNVDTAEKVAKRWLQAIEAMERHKGNIHIMRYEDLIRRPDQELEVLGRWLGVDPGGFAKSMVRDSSIGKYKTRLSREELATVMEIAGPTMARLGYL